MQLVERRVKFEFDHHGVHQPISISQTFINQEPLDELHKRLLDPSSIVSTRKTLYFPWLHLGRPHMLRKEIVQKRFPKEELDFNPFMDRYSEFLLDLKDSLSIMNNLPDKVIANGLDVVGVKYQYLTLSVERTESINQLFLLRETLINQLKEFLQSFKVENPDLFLSTSAVLQFQTADTYVPRVPLGPLDQFRIGKNTLVSPIELKLSPPGFINVSIN